MNGEVMKYPWYVSFLEGFAIPNAEIFSFVVAWGEVLVGLGLIVGVFQEMGGVTIHHFDTLEKMLPEEVTVAILTVPVHAAQNIADRLVEAGIKGILNFTPARLSVPDSVRVHHIDLSVELQSLVYFRRFFRFNWSGCFPFYHAVNWNEKSYWLSL